MNIPNSLTLFRILLIPVFVIIFYLPFHWSYVVSGLVFFVAGFTDILDGYLARKLNQSTPFGAFLDPVADKLMVAIALGLLIERFHDWTFTIPALIIIGREIVISALREWMAEIGKRTSVAVSMVGKVKTFCQMATIFLFLMLDLEKEVPILKGLGEPIAYITLYTAAVLTLWSMLIYLKAAWPELKKNTQ
ncbi:MAG: CDP-diacylglycerol--glycerol-3-phosphate 3-phosphatidyltransferase [Pseudomonadales bacterium]|nr:CDP-diacylglycerol--glycerol-3-phosphate 3-phosphatidyltransferase [Pseudomonadales bacterium]